jgi:hypothetical protein
MPVLTVVNTHESGVVEENHGRADLAPEGHPAAQPP